MTANYLVIKETYAWRECSACRGAGVKTSQFRGQKFKNTCPTCGGNRRVKITHRTEVSLEEALNEIHSKNKTS